MRRNWSLGRHPRLSRLKDGTWSCEEIDTYFEKRGESLAGIDAIVVGPAGYLGSISVSYPIPQRLRLDGGIEIEFSELWLHLGKKRRIFAVFDSSGRVPSAHRLVDH